MRSTDAGSAGTWKDGILNGSRRHSHRDSDGGDVNEYSDDGATCMNKRRDPVDEQRLLAWRKEKKSWKYIFHQLPSRSEGVGPHKSSAFVLLLILRCKAKIILNNPNAHAIIALLFIH